MTLWLSQAGMSAWAGLTWVVMFLLGVILMTRIVGETGAFNAQVLAEPSATLADGFGLAETLGGRNLCVMSFQGYINGGDWGRGYLMPNMMQSLKLAVDGHWPKRRVIAALCLAAVIAMPISFYAAMTLLYENGAGNAAGWAASWNFNTGPTWALQKPANWLEHPLSPEAKWLNRTGVVVYAGITGLLIYLRSVFYWLPLHPLGFLISGGFVGATMFLSVLLGWCGKFMVLRYGGGRLYVQVRTVFIGVILGEFVMLAFWGLVKHLSGGVGYMPPGY